MGNEEVAIVQVMGEFELDVLAPLSPERVALDAGGRSRHLARIRREGRLRGTICAWPTDEWSRRVYPGARAAEGAAQARAGHPLVLPARAEGPARPQGVDAAPRDAAPARDAADAPRPARGARTRPRHEPAAEDRAVLDVARRRREGSLGPADRDERADGGVLHLARTPRRPRERSAARARAASAAA